MSSSFISFESVLLHRFFNSSLQFRHQVYRCLSQSTTSRIHYLHLTARRAGKYFLPGGSLNIYSVGLCPSYSFFTQGETTYSRLNCAYLGAQTAAFPFNLVLPALGRQKYAIALLNHKFISIANHFPVAV